jgi:hypothetical protein
MGEGARMVGDERREKGWERGRGWEMRGERKDGRGRGCRHLCRTPVFNRRTPDTSCASSAPATFAPIAAAPARAAAFREWTSSAHLCITILMIARRHRSPGLH